MSQPLTQTRTRLHGIEALRGAGAVAVVLYHVARHLAKAHGGFDLLQLLQFGHAGVDLFFVLSGFIIVFVHGRDIGHPRCAGHYARRRFVRVMPIYWVALLLTLCMNLAGGHGMPSFGRLAMSLTLLPSNVEPLLGVAWTLQYEIVFYAAFSVLILSRRAGTMLFAGWLAWIVLEKFTPALAFDAAPQSIWDAYNFEFFLGMAMAWCLRAGSVPKPRLALAAGALLFAVAAVAEDANFLDGYSALARLVYGVPSALIVLGVAGAEQSGALRTPAWMRELGGASYSIYLFQFVFIGIGWKLWLATGLDGRAADWVTFPLLAGLAIGGGIGAARLVEKPLIRLIRLWSAGPVHVFSARPGA